MATRGSVRTDFESHENDNVVVQPIASGSIGRGRGRGQGRGRGHGTGVDQPVTESMLADKIMQVLQETLPQMLTGILDAIKGEHSEKEIHKEKTDDNASG
ncbi:hypothetical protein L6452_15048 [Arctium lappa]|uniref:Uncharacterized protein n=1 Tax=Arctium lappa TaxID=4217 RepID=A0ACB9CMT7_ARCLA|nr:hypothetical protein L6452_15048 [Arctium lappa]